MVIKWILRGNMRGDKFTEDDSAKNGAVNGDDTLVVVLAAATTGHRFYRLRYHTATRMSHIFIYQFKIHQRKTKFSIIYKHSSISRISVTLWIIRDYRCLCHIYLLMRSGKKESHSPILSLLTNESLTIDNQLINSDYWQCSACWLRFPNKRKMM